MSKITCTKCNQKKPATREFFRPRPASKTGFTKECRDCSGNVLAVPRVKVWRKKPKTLAREALALQQLQMCTKCGDIKPFDEFGPYPRAKSGRYSWCRICVAVRAKAKQAARRRDPVQRAKLLAEKSRYAKSDRGVAQKRKSSEIDNHKRRQRMLRTAWNWSVKQWNKCKDTWGNKCAYCGKAKTLTQDHFIPLSHPDCPGTVPHNMIPACPSCNYSKGAIHPYDWIVDAAVLRKIETYFASIECLKGESNDTEVDL